MVPAIWFQLCNILEKENSEDNKMISNFWGEAKEEEEAAK